MLIDFTWKDHSESATFSSDGTYQFHGKLFDYVPGYWHVIDNHVVSLYSSGSKRSAYSFGGNDETINDAYHFTLAKMFFESKENR